MLRLSISFENLGQALYGLQSGAYRFLLKKGEVVLDLGYGDGLDLYSCAKAVGQRGRVYGLNISEEIVSPIHPVENTLATALKSPAPKMLQPAVSSNSPLSANSTEILVSDFEFFIRERRELVSDIG
jgi:23S rRNA U2552 (ribose-2'-O)-methylase RlmE/FtsJ